jgi:predicted RNA-binding protein with TRAM domain
LPIEDIRWRDGVATVVAYGRTIFVADAHRGDGERLVVHADEKLTAFLELESVIHRTISF